MTPEELDAQKLAHAERQFEAEIELRRAELDLRRDEMLKTKESEASRPVWNSAPGIAVLGGLFTLLTAVLSNFVQGCTSNAQRTQEHETQIALERQQFQSELIQTAIERAGDNEDAAVNLNFLWEAGLVSDYEKIPEILKKYAHLEEKPPTLPSRQTFGSSLGPITGRDDRVRISDTTQTPYSAICSLEIVSADGRRLLGTGFLVSPRLVITAGSNLYSSNLGFAKSVTVSIGRNGDELPYGQLTSTELRVSREWEESQDSNFDFGAIILPSAVTNPPVLELESQTTKQLASAAVTIAGYAVDKRGTIWASTGELEIITDKGLGYLLDTGYGVSGAPLVVTENNNHRVIGIHVYSGDTIRAVRITNDVLDAINNWIKDSTAIASAND